MVLIQVLDEKDGKDREFREESRQAEEKLEAKDREASAFSPRVALRTPPGLRCSDHALLQIERLTCEKSDEATKANEAPPPPVGD